MLIIKERPPELVTDDWFNTNAPIPLQSLLGRVVLLEAFQMLCPACVSHALPQIQRAANYFAHDDVTVLGLHTVFEHHEAQGSRQALAAFIHEYRLTFPIAMDRPSLQGELPQTMRAYLLEGTPTLMLFDRRGRLRKQHFGIGPDLELGSQITTLLREQEPESREEKPESTVGREGLAPASEDANTPDGCDVDGCPI
ncbi:MAG: TlpA disulfide reductase family protein [Pseudomonadota bacterium]